RYEDGANVCVDHADDRVEAPDVPAAVGRPWVAEPADALLVVAERGGVLQRVGHVEQGRGGPGVVPVDEPGDVAVAPDRVPRAEVAVADDLAGRAGPGAAGPHAGGGRAVAGDRVVVAAEEPGPPLEAGLGDDVCPAIGAR